MRFKNINKHPSLRTFPLSIVLLWWLSFVNFRQSHMLLIAVVIMIIVLHNVSIFNRLFFYSPYFPGTFAPITICVRKSLHYDGTKRTLIILFFRSPKLQIDYLSRYIYIYMFNSNTAVYRSNKFHKFSN